MGRTVAVAVHRVCGDNRVSVRADRLAAVRVPYAEGTPVVLPGGEDDALMPSLLALTDVMSTGHHAPFRPGFVPDQEPR